MAEWAVQNPWLTFFLVLAALRIAWAAIDMLKVVALRKRERVVRFEGPGPIDSTVTVKQMCPRCRAVDLRVPDQTVEKVKN